MANADRVHAELIETQYLQARNNNELAAIFGKLHVRYVRALDKLDTLLLQPRCQRTNDGIVLIVNCSLHAGERLDAWKLVHETMKIALELDRAVPRLKGEGCLPHVPEVRLEEWWGQPVRDAAVAELFLRSFSQPN